MCPLRDRLRAGYARPPPKRSSGLTIAGGGVRTDVRLFVGRRDATRLAEGLTRQVEAVSAGVERSEIDPLPRIVPVLCFVDGEWPWFRPPDEFRGVRLESAHSIKRLFAASADLDPVRVEGMARALATGLPAKGGAIARESPLERPR